MARAIPETEAAAWAQVDPFITHSVPTFSFGLQK